MRASLWENLREEIEAEFHQPHPLTGEAQVPAVWPSDGWLFSDLESLEDRRAREQETRAQRLRLGLCVRCKEPRAEGSKNFCHYHVALNRPSVRRQLAAGIAASSTQRSFASPKAPANDECPLHGRVLRLRLISGTYYCTKKGCTYQQARRRRGVRERIQDPTRPGVTQHFTIVDIDGNVDGYITTGEYADGRLGEVFLKIGKPGSQDALFDQWAIAVSVALQYGAPARELLGKFAHTKFRPSGGVLGVEGIKRCGSPLDLIARYLIEKYGGPEFPVEETQP